jgi:uncharacterized membrane protein
MELLLFIAFVIIIILLVKLRSNQKVIAERTHQSFLSLKKELIAIKEAANAGIKNDTPLKATDEEVVQWRPYIAPTIEKVIVAEPPISTPAPIEITTETPATPIIEPTPIAVAATNETKKIIPTEPALSWWQQWLQNNPDLEKFVGENLVNKIGIAVLVLGIAFFVKYAIDQDWIKESGRVIIGIGCGAILVGIAHYLRNSYRSFSSVLAGGGIAVFYFTIAFAFHQYQLFSQTAAFIIMIFITAFAVALSLLYNKIELAVIAVIGGFLAPFLVSSGSGNYVVLFSYLIILNIGMLTIAFFKKWPLLHILSFFFTLLIYGGWLINSFGGNKPLPYVNGLLFATAFYVIFLTIVLIHNLRTQKSFKAFDFSLLMMITFSYYAEGMTLLSQWNNGAYQGIFTITLGLVNLCLAWFLYKSQQGDKDMLYLLIGLTLTFVSLSAPVQMHGHTITMFWSAECVLIYWLHQRSRIQIFKYSSAIVLLLMTFSLLMDWSIANDKSATFIPVIFTNWQGTVTNIVTILSLGLYTVLLRKATPTEEYVLSIKNSIFSNCLAIAAILVLYVTCIFGINLAFISEQSFNIPNAYHQLITYSFTAIVLFVINRMQFVKKPFLSIALILISFVFYFSCNRLSNNLIRGVIENHDAGVHAGIHWLSALFMLYLLYQLIQLFRKNSTVLGNKFTWLINVLLLFYFSLECNNLYVMLLANPLTFIVYTSQYLKAGLTIVWAVFSFVIMWLGMRHKYKTLRIISLSIFSLALLKLFLSDISNISEGGKIAAFIMLGILLLVISFMYQRLKKIIIDNEEKTL